MRSYCHAALGDISMFPLRCPMHHAGTFHSSLLPTPSTRRHRRPGAQAARRTSRTCTHGAYWEGRSTASSWDFCVKINQCVGRHNVLISAQVDFYDRSVLGEGIHCLKCGSFVNLPRDGDPMVQCCVGITAETPHAIEQFLHRSNVRIVPTVGACGASARWTLGGNQISFIDAT